MPADAYVLLLRDVHDGDLPEPVEVHWLRGVGLDRTIRECGIAVVRNPVPFVPLSLRDRRVRLYRPISEKIRPPAGPIGRHHQRCTSGHFDWDSGPKAWGPGIVATSRR